MVTMRQRQNSFWKTHNGARRRGAFTLVELLVVIGIIALVAAILFPVFAQAKEKGRQTVCLSNMRQLGMAFNQYATDNEEMFPVACPVPDWWGEGWAYSLQLYTKTYDIYVCPSDGKDAVFLPGWSAPVASMSYSPNAYLKDADKGRYGAIALGGKWMTDAAKEPFPLLGLANISRGAETILLGERHNSDLKARGKYGQGVLGYPPFTGLETMDSWFEPSETPNGTATAPWPRGSAGTVTAKHNGMANFCFVDGHVKAVKPEATNPDPVNQPDRNMWDASRK